MVLIGKRRNYIAIQVATRTSDGQGGYTVTWADTYYEWAKATFLSGSKTLNDGGIRYRRAVDFVIRKRDDYTLSGDHRISWNGDYYTIYSVLPSDKFEDLKVLAYAE